MPPREKLTHFLCIPLVNEASRPALEKSLAAFKKDAFPDHGPAAAPGQTPQDSFSSPTAAPQAAPPAPRLVPSKLSEAAVRPVGTLHLTLGVMALHKPEQLDRAINVLAELNLERMLHRADRRAHSKSSEESAEDDGAPASTADAAGASTADAAGALTEHSHKRIPGAEAPLATDATPPEPLTISLRSLHPMQDRSKTSVLYAKPHDATGRLESFCLSVRGSFASEQLVLDDSRPLKLHATIVNTVYDRKQKAAGRTPGGRQPVKFDAGPLLDAYAEYVWAADVRLDRVAICEMGAKETLSAAGVADIAYREIAARALPYA